MSSSNNHNTQCIILAIVSLDISQVAVLLERSLLAKSLFSIRNLMACNKFKSILVLEVIPPCMFLLAQSFDVKVHTLCGIKSVGPLKTLYTSPSSRPVLSDIHSTFLGSIQPLCDYCTNNYPLTNVHHCLQPGNHLHS